MILLYLGPGPSMFIISVFGSNSDGGLAPAVTGQHEAFADTTRLHT